MWFELATQLHGKSPDAVPATYWLLGALGVICGVLSCGLTEGSAPAAGGAGMDADVAAGTGGVGGRQGTSCTGDRAIQTAQQFADLVAEACQSISGTLTLRGVDAEAKPTNLRLTSLRGLESLTAVGRGLYIQANPALSSCRGLEGLERVGVLGIWDNPALRTLGGLDQLRHVAGRLAIQGNGSLSSLSGLQSIESVGAELELSGNPALSSLAPWHGWPQTAVKGALFIHDNAELARCESDLFDAEQVQPTATCFIQDIDQCAGNTGTGGCRSPER